MAVQRVGRFKLNKSGVHQQQGVDRLGSCGMESAYALKRTRYLTWIKPGVH